MEAMEAKTDASPVDESAIVERVARIMNTVRGAKSDYSLLVAELELTLPFDVFGVVLLRHDRKAIRAVICRREKGKWVTEHRQHPLSGSMVERMLKAPILLVNDYPEGLDGAPAVCGDALSSYPQLHSTLIAPLVVEDRVLGTLELGSVDSGVYADQTLQRLVNAVARVLAAAIESAQLGGSAELQNRQREALKAVTNALTSKLDIPTILHRIVRGIAHALNVASAIVIVDRRRNCLSFAAHAGFQGDAEELEQVFQETLPVRDGCIISRTIHAGNSVVSNDIAVDEEFPASRFFASRLGIHSVLSYPLHTGNMVFGALLLCSPETGGFTPLKADILALFAGQASFAIHNGLLLDSAHRRSRFQRAIEKLERAQQQRLVAQDDGEVLREELRLLEQIHKETKRTFGIKFSSLLRFVSDHLLTLREQTLEAAMFAELADRRIDEEAKLESVPIEVLPEDLELQPLADGEEPEPRDDVPNTVALLTRAAEAALVGTGMVGELTPLMIKSNGINDAWLVIDLEGRCTYMNPEAEALCETRIEGMSRLYNSSTILSREPEAASLESVFVKLIPRMRNRAEVLRYLHDFGQEGNSRQEIRCILAPAPVSEKEQVGEGCHRTPLSEIFPGDRYYRFTRHPLPNHDGLLVAHVLQVHDITEEVREEKHRSALLTSVSHDLRTPLTTIKAAVSGLLQEGVEWDEEDKRMILEDIETETDHLTALVNALVELSRIEMGALVLAREWCDVAEVLHGALSKLGRILGERNVKEEIVPSVPLIYVDHVQLERVFYNLIENAARHIPEDEEITVSMAVRENELEVRVVDLGSEIPAHGYERERIFTSFYSSRSYGNGLSLAICKGIVEAHGGHIWVEPNRVDEDGKGGKGACFVFTLPLLEKGDTPVEKR
ncbi:GAF domain-containing protein [Thermosporothrix hazakensis]|jgi:signal transduction histidine kinase/GAF domain-containing protein|uniref:histidine kinase n=2 Tax=Thermosporothrix hazakensis TaxID=644383 RepID=A0A326U6M2_THEHA|nr:GAF domain-containing protein [Thermosporothrix hazakensis]